MRTLRRVQLSYEPHAILDSQTIRIIVNTEGSDGPKNYTITDILPCDDMESQYDTVMAVMSRKLKEFILFESGHAHLI